MNLPERRAELYKQCVDILLTKWDASRGIRRIRAFQPEHKRRLLEEIAWHFHSQGKRYMPENELLNVIADFLPIIGVSPEQQLLILEEIVSENGLLKEQAYHWYGFLHLTLQEYFVALYLADQKPTESVLPYSGDPWWEEVILLYAGHIPDASSLLQMFLEVDASAQHDIFHADLLLAGRCLAVRPLIRKTKLRDTIIQCLFHHLKCTQYTLLKSSLADVLAEIGGYDVNTKLVHLLSDPQPTFDLHMSIANALGRLGERSAALELMRLLSDPQLSSLIRMSIANALGQLGERSVVPELVRLLSDPQLDSNIRVSITDILKTLVDNTEIVKELTLLLTISDIADDIYSLLWIASQRLRIKISVVNMHNEPQVEIIPTSDQT
ncbi:MAG: HEAT repeat domain-containing protein [Ktedonobacteraceae bacterium]|nr:HEAT repeat domain-containing protein [Ktedonobacteraceae bacterium]